MVSIVQANDRKLFLRVFFLVLIASTIVQPSFAVDGGESPKSWFSFGWLKAAMAAGGVAVASIGVIAFAQNKAQLYEDQSVACDTKVTLLNEFVSGRLFTPTQKERRDVEKNCRNTELWKNCRSTDNENDVLDKLDADLRYAIITNMKRINDLGGTNRVLLNRWLVSKCSSLAAQGKHFEHSPEGRMLLISRELIKEDGVKWKLGDQGWQYTCQVGYNNIKQDYQFCCKEEIATLESESAEHKAFAFKWGAVKGGASFTLGAIGGVAVSVGLWNQYQQSPASRTSL